MAEECRAEPSTANSMTNATPLIDRRDRQVWLFRLHRPYEFLSPCPDREFALLLVVGDETVNADEQWELATQFVHQSCRYAVCFGHDCSSWDDAIDMVTVIEEVDGLPPRPFVMTTWHDTDTLQETVEYFAGNTRFDDWVPSRLVAVILGGDKRLEQSVREALRKHLG